MNRKLILVASSAALLFSLSACAAKTATPATTTTTPVTTITTPATTTTTPATTAAPAEKTFTVAELAAFNGKNGAKAYVAISGIVYDVTNVKGWNSGSHNGVTAGKDLTAAFQSSPHNASTLSGLTVVGKLV